MRVAWTTLAIATSNTVFAGCVGLCACLRGGILSSIVFTVLVAFMPVLVTVGIRNKTVFIVVDVTAQSSGNLDFFVECLRADLTCIGGLRDGVVCPCGQEKDDGDNGNKNAGGDDGHDVFFPSQGVMIQSGSLPRLEL